jgi:hypothetical protein
MARANRSGRVAGEAQSRAERGPVRQAKYVGVLDERDGLALSRVASAK